MRFVTITENPVASDVATYARQFVPYNWRHKIDVRHGFESASFQLQARQTLLERLFYDGLGHDVVRYSTDGNAVIWRGYISRMILSSPGMRAETSLDNMYNRLAVRYTELDTTANPPTETADQTTAAANDTDSQSRYGIRELIYRPSVTKLTQVMAEQLRDTLLSEYKRPRPGADYSSQQQEVSLQIECKGYTHTLAWRIYNQTTNSGTQNASTIIDAILTSVGDFIASTSVDENTLQVNRYFDDDKTALELLHTILALGDASDNRWIMQVLEDRQLKYKQASKDIKYFRRMSDPRQALYDLMSREVPPWEVRPDGLLLTTDINPMIPDPASDSENPRLAYIESVEWTENGNELSMTGSGGDELQSYIAKLAGQGEILL